MVGQPTAHSIRRKKVDGIFRVLCFLCALTAVIFLVILLGTVLKDGAMRLRPDFFTKVMSRFPGRAGINTALMGTIWVILLTAAISVPVGIAAAIFLEEFTKKSNRVMSIIQLNIQNLAGVPSIVYGLLGLALFVRTMALDRSVIAGALTMSLLILPTIIVVSQEAIRAIPSGLREGSLALGATRWQTLRGQVLPNALPGIITGIILSISRAAGESAPLITIGAVTYIASAPAGLGDKFTVLPIQIFDWAGRPQKGFHENAAAAIICLLAVLLVLNGLAVYIRSRSEKK